ncbi:MAG: GDP-D-mannose-3',5'-epimerase [Sylvanvirus sp.]|uniref:GDP-D-mannose-3',5'-epimerase n=1 Tax=Sylvanvirus sp. TaxID=2487774 RepID=A0A3G5AHS2_9VIRU|nr:MAG: GDP-D-mannose-3',5'-epimerase [Sylvanvirus sp.]
MSMSSSTSLQTLLTLPRCLVTGGGGFIGGHLARRLKLQGWYVIIADLKFHDYFETHEICHEFYHFDLRLSENCDRLFRMNNIDEVYHLASDMGGMGYIAENNATILHNNMRMDLNMLEAARKAHVKRFFYASTACVYPEYRQDTEQVNGLKESDVFPAKCQDAYGWEKLFMEMLCEHYHKDFRMETRIGRFHNIFGEYGTWKGGREKFPASCIRKVLVSGENEGKVEVWGDGEQTRSFCHVDDCIDGILLIMASPYPQPFNVGSDRLISMNDMVRLVAQLAQKQVHIVHIPGPQGVRGRNSDNTYIQGLLHWQPCMHLEEGILKTMVWIQSQLNEEDRTIWHQYASSQVIRNQPIDLEEKSPS